MGFTNESLVLERTSICTYQYQTKTKDNHKGSSRPISRTPRSHQNSRTGNMRSLVAKDQYLSLSHPSQWNPSGFLGFLANFHKCPNGSQSLGFHPTPTLFLPHSYLIPSEFPLNSTCTRHSIQTIIRCEMFMFAYVFSM